jgi:GcrA cell cycle regulator
MSWTDERIETLKKLWAEGLSASQIAGELGSVTRNAVIGKVHRLGLSGRAKTASVAPQRPRKAAPAPSRSATAPTASSGIRTTMVPMTTLMRGSAALKAEEIIVAQGALAPVSQIQDVVVPMSRRVSIMELKEGICRWPLGDPMHADFVYCGADCSTGTPYCGFHSKVAYQQPHDRRAREAQR